jgi:peptidoglycan/LPS O-acetylase OafA/YrhL
MDELALGAGIAVVVRGSLRKQVLRWAPLTFILSAGVVVSMCCLRHSVDHSDPVISSVGFSAIALTGGSLLMCCLIPGSLTERLFSFRPLRILGKYSYGFYVYHFPLSVFLSPLKEMLVGWSRSYIGGSVLYLSTCLATNLLVAAISFHLLESPIMGMKRRFHYAPEISIERDASLTPTSRYRETPAVAR